jgi:hypothetical protein
VRVFPASGLATNNPTQSQELDPFGTALADGVFVG